MSQLRGRVCHLRWDHVNSSQKQARTRAKNNIAMEEPPNPEGEDMEVQDDTSSNEVAVREAEAVMAVMEAEVVAAREEAFY